MWADGAPLHEARSGTGRAAGGGGYETKPLSLITANRGRAVKWLGAASDQIFDMPLSVGGRFSLWSAASLACMAGFGAQTFREILAGARAMDEHVRTSPIATTAAATASRKLIGEKLDAATDRLSQKQHAGHDHSTADRWTSPAEGCIEKKDTKRENATHDQTATVRNPKASNGEARYPVERHSNNPNMQTRDRQQMCQTTLPEGASRIRRNQASIPD